MYICMDNAFIHSNLLFTATGLFFFFFFHYGDSGQLVISMTLGTINWCNIFTSIAYCLSKLNPCP
uniref:Uncharacterized protein n=1 Tax=Rhizophora mucronata TaxID=61149 RepID=A0A2P2J4C5_RHIMU